MRNTLGTKKRTERDRMLKGSCLIEKIWIHLYQKEKVQKGTDVQEEVKAYEKRKHATSLLPAGKK